MSVTSCLRVLCCSMCLFLYRPLCHVALKLDLSTLFTKNNSINISSIYINTLKRRVN